MEFMNRDFLLDTETAGVLYHRYAEEEPIFDYHNHLSPRDIAEHRHFHDLTELWLSGDHYKWRAMRMNGIPERLVTGSAPSKDKFLAFASVLPKLAGSPLYHWAHLELQRFFAITEPLSPRTAEAVWEKTRAFLSEEGFDAVSLLNKMKVKVLCTTDDPLDTLEWHRKIREDKTIPFLVLPSFRPDSYLPGPKSPSSRDLMEKYEASDLNTALERALDYFLENGCLVSDHGFSDFPYGKDPGFTERMRFLGAAYEKRGIVMQLHFGAIRNNSPRLMKEYGRDAGGDSIGSLTDPSTLGLFLHDLEEQGALPKTILYNLNPADNRMLATMAGNFGPRVQFGAAWWFNDHLRGIEAQLDELMETGALAVSVGMLTDSRSFSSFVRHEYFRRILCRKLGRLVEEGLYPWDEEILGAMVRGVCYHNADAFFRR